MTVAVGENSERDNRQTEVHLPPVHLMSDVAFVRVAVIRKESKKKIKTFLFGFHVDFLLFLYIFCFIKKESKGLSATLH